VRLLIPFSFLVALAIGCVLGLHRDDTVAVNPGSIAERVVARARVEPRRGEVRVRAHHAGRVVALKADLGDRVDAGGSLAELAHEDGTTEILRAPIDGVVLARRASVGEDVGPGEPVFEVADAREIQLRFELEDADASRVAVGAPLRVTAAGGGPVLAEAAITRLSARLEPHRLGAGDPGGARGGLVRVGFAELAPSDALALGREVEVEIELPRRLAVARLPRSAVTIRSGRLVVVSPRPLGGVELPIRLGASDAENVEVFDLRPGSFVLRAP